MKENLAIEQLLKIRLARAVGHDLKISGMLHIVLKDAAGQIKDDEITRNLIVTAGRQHAADQMAGQTQAAMSHMAIGTGTAAAALTDTALQTELDRNALAAKTQGEGTDANKVTFQADWGAGDGTGAITEAGIFNSASAGTMLCRSVFAVKNKGAGDTLSLTWTLTFSA